MTVEALIELLKKEDPKSEVVVATSNFEQGNSDVLVSHVYNYKGKMKKRTFTDAFDYEKYDKIMPTIDDAGDKVFVKLS